MSLRASLNLRNCAEWFNATHHAASPPMHIVMESPTRPRLSSDLDPRNELKRMGFSTVTRVMAANTMDNAMHAARTAAESLGNISRAIIRTGQCHKYSE